MNFCRLDLSKTFYKEYPEASRLTGITDLAQFEEIYKKYCRHKKFDSVMPLFLSQFQDPANDLHVYYDQDQIVAWSLCHRYDGANVESLQFAWDYKNPRLKLGRRSLKHECAYYKQLGYQYLYLGEAANYKAELDGYELLGEI